MRNTTRPMSFLYPGYVSTLSDTATMFGVAEGGCPCPVRANLRHGQHVLSSPVAESPARLHWLAAHPGSGSDHQRLLHDMAAMKTRRPQRLTFAHGFSLVEMAVVLVIVALLITGLVIPFSAQQEIRARQETERTLTDIHEALLGYAEPTAGCPVRPLPPATVSNPRSAGYALALPRIVFCRRPRLASRRSIQSDSR